MSETVVIFGDVHGESEKLRSLIDEARSRWGEVSFYGLGDFIDRGKDSKGVVQILIDENIRGILGNHELWFRKLLEIRRFDDMALNPVMGGVATLNSYRLGVRWPERNVNLVPQDHKDYILRLPLYRSIEVAGTTYWLIHAGVKEAAGRAVWQEVEKQMAQHGLTGDDVPELVLPETFERANVEEILWAHYKANSPNLFKFPHGGVQVVGHTPLKEPLDGGHYICLDTGCGRKGRSPLSGAALHPDGTRTLFSVE